MTWLRIHHRSTYRHSTPTGGTWQTLRLRPRKEAGQVCRDFSLHVTPEPGEVAEGVDAFGNITHHFSLNQAHDELVITVDSIARRDPTALPATEIPFAEAVRATTVAITTGEFGLEQFRHPSRHVPHLADIRPVADLGPTANGEVIAWIRALGERVATQFRFDPTASDVSTSLATVLQTRRGVCQDFAHLFIACARSLGLAAGYVSGYILTEPPAGQARLRGADAMHAWVTIWVPGHGWIDFDPTNNAFPNRDYVVVARGRDYADVSPIRGVFNGGGAHPLWVGVTVEPIEEPPPLDASPSVT